MVGPDGQPVPFHRGQDLAYDSDRRIIALFAGTQAGKTGWGPWWLKAEIDRMGAGDYLAVTATYDLFKLKMLPAFLYVFEQLLGLGRFWAGDKVFELKDPKTGRYHAQKSTDPMWGRVILRSAQSEGGLESSTAKAAWLDEAGQDEFSLKAWRAIRRRLALNRGRILITTTLYNLGWTKQQVIDKAVDGGAVTLEKIGDGELELTDNPEADIALIQFDSIVNPAYPLDEYRQAEAELPSDEFEMQYRGRATKLRTLIYDVFDDKIHKVRSFRPPVEWPRIVGIDPIGEQIGALWLAFDPDKSQLHLFREYLEPFGLTTEQHAENILRESRHDRVIAWICGQPAERQARLDWAGAGIPVVEPPFADVWVGINRVYALFKTFSLVVHDNCENFLSEIGTYQRLRDRNGELTDKIKDKEKYHLCDALRYPVAWLTDPAEVNQVVKVDLRIGADF